MKGNCYVLEVICYHGKNFYLMCSDFFFPASETFAKETTSAVGSLVGVDNDDDDDVVIVDADSPLSRCHNVKSSSELRSKDQIFSFMYAVEI